MRGFAVLFALVCSLVPGCGRNGEADRAAPEALRMKATAYSIKGETASGAQTRRGVVAADPGVLPLGTRIRIRGAGAYDGVYTVADTGRKVKGREVDIFMPSGQEAEQFGTRTVTVEVLARGETTGSNP